MQPKRTGRPYELRPYDPTWKDTFERIAEHIKPIFGDNLISIEHIGSTSIEGMMAKPQIDILVVVKDQKLIDDLYGSFLALGYHPQGREYVGNGDYYVTKDAPDGKRLASIHILEEGHPQIAEYREFREYLKANKDDRDLYIATKQHLYSNHHNNYEMYDRGKTEIIENIKARAREWAQTQ